jgi:hypothetical protein
MMEEIKPQPIFGNGPDIVMEDNGVPVDSTGDDEVGREDERPKAADKEKEQWSHDGIHKMMSAQCVCESGLSVLDCAC